MASFQKYLTNRKGDASRPFTCTLVLIVLFSCGRQREYWKPAEIAVFIDSIGSGRLIAGYLQDSACTLIIRCDSPFVVRVTRRNGFPENRDTLKQTTQTEYVSLRYRYSYLIGDTDVTERFYQKIIHPSSNWQGQTPGTEVILSHFRRIR
jgi:hypothetical protein